LAGAKRLHLDHRLGPTGFRGGLVDASPLHVQQKNDQAIARRELAEEILNQSVCARWIHSLWALLGLPTPECDIALDLPSFAGLLPVTVANSGADPPNPASKRAVATIGREMGVRFDEYLLHQFLDILFGPAERPHPPLKAWLVPLNDPSKRKTITGLTPVDVLGILII
jgi:hypothetical protein